MALYCTGARPCPQARVLGAEVGLGVEMKRKRLRGSSGLDNALSSSLKGNPEAGAVCRRNPEQEET